MSDALLTRIAEAVEGLRADLKKGGGAVAPKPADKAPAAAPKGDVNAVASDTTKTPAQKKAEADKLIAQKKAQKEAADKAAAAAGKPTGTKAPGGKHTIDQVREMIRKVAADIDKPSAKNILMDDGGGVEKVLDLKPENYDAVYEACEVLLNGEGKGAAAAPADDDDFG